MKPAILLPCFLFLFVFVSQSQIDKGHVQIGGNVGGSYQTYKNSFQGTYRTIGAINFSPSVGKFYKANKMIGTFLTFGYNEGKGTSSYINRYYGAGLFLRQYQPLFQKVYLLFDERAGYVYNANNYDGVFTDYHNINLSVQMGFAYDVTKKFQLELLINNLLYGRFSYSKQQGNLYNLGTSLENTSLSNVAIGFHYFLK